MERKNYKSCSLGEIWEFDFETVVHNNIHLPKYGKHWESVIYLCCGINFDKTKKFSTFLKTDNPNQVMDELFAFIKKEKIKYIMFHNLSFDGEYIYKYLISNNYKNVIKISSSRINQFSTLYTKNDLIELKMFNVSATEKLTTTFHCSYLKSRIGVNDMGDGKTKFNHQDVDFMNLTQDDINYCMNDVIQVVDYFNLVFANTNFSNDKKLRKWFNATTISSLVYKKIKTNNHYRNLKMKKLNKPCYDLEYDYDDYQIDKFSFRGGFTNYNLNYQNKIINQRGIQLDINSSYPYQIIKPLPTEEIDKQTYQTLSKENRAILYKIKVFNIRQNYPGITIFYKKRTFLEPEIVDYKYLFKEHLNIEHDVILNVWENELKYLNIFHFKKDKYFPDYQILQTRYFKLEKIKAIEYEVKKLVNDKFFLTKIKKQTKDKLICCQIKAKIDAIKQEVNSIYGKLAQKPDFTNRYVSLQKLTKGDKIPIKNQTYIVDTVKDVKYGDYYAYDIYNMEHAKKAKRIIQASFITANARCQIYYHLYLNIKYWIKSDTDSLFFLCDIYNLHPETRKLIGDELGQFKLEYKFDKIHIAKAKAYQVLVENGENLIKASGFNRKKLKELALKNEWILQYKNEFKDIDTYKIHTKYGISILDRNKLFSPDNFYK